VILIHGGQKYYFIADYHAYEGRDLMLQWANVKPMTWGSGTSGQLGNSDILDSLVPVVVNAADALWGKLPLGGAAGGSHSLGMCTDGMLVAWGLNANGQLGIGGNSPSPVPVAVTIPGVPLTRAVVAVSAGTSHSLALCSDGAVMAWGLNANGQLGNSSTTQSDVPVAVTTSSGALHDKTVVAISAGASHSLALCSDGTVAAWGLNDKGQLGNSSSTAQFTAPVTVTASSGALHDKTVVAISAGGSHSLALCSDGSVAAWGSNANGQLGNNTSITQSTTPLAVTPTGALEAATVSAIAAGGSHSLALCDDGLMAAWGMNTSGQLGNNSNTQSWVPVLVENSSGALNGKAILAISAGANHSLALCTDWNASTVAAWGLNSSGQLGDNSTFASNVPVEASSADLYPAVFLAIVSGSSANHSMSLVAAPEIDVGNFGIQKQITYDQSSAAAPTLDSDVPYMFISYVNASTMGVLLSSSTLTPPTGSTGGGVYQAGTSGLRLMRYFRTKEALDLAFTAGTYFLKIQTSTPNTYETQLTFNEDAYPAIPQITGMTNATWSDGVLKITDASKDVTITWNNPGVGSSYFQIDNSSIRSEGGTASTSFTIPGNSLDGNAVCRGSIQFYHSDSEGGASIPGLPGATGDASYQTRVQFLISTGDASASSPPFMYLLFKNHVLAQTSNNDPADSPNVFADSDLAPYSLTIESPEGGTVSGPNSTSLPLGYYADNDASSYLYMSDGVASSSILNASYPNGTYTFPNSISVGLTGDGYPGATKILAVNGGPPVWNAQGELALDPTIENTITWLAVDVPDFSTKGHQSVYFENYDDPGFETLETETGVLTEFPDPITELIVPKSSMTATYTYVGNINYISASTTSNPDPDVYAVGGYATAIQFVAVALKPQTLTFGEISEKSYPCEPFELGASVSSGLPVSYSVVTGPATVEGSTLTLVGTGTVTLQASQPGTGVYASAISVTRSFTVTAASPLTSFRSENGLAADGSEDLLCPAQDGVANLLKYAFNMIGSGTGQAATLSMPNVQTVGVSGTAGLPRPGINGSDMLTLTYIRRKADTSPGVTYAVEFSNNLSAVSWAVNSSATESVTSLDADFERVTVTDSVSLDKRFARVRVSQP
jgi:alpha-tubulin suppressor-like RCC1 family protein